MKFIIKKKYLNIVILTDGSVIKNKSVKKMDIQVLKKDNLSKKNLFKKK